MFLHKIRYAYSVESQGAKNMEMKVQDLINELEDLDPEMEIRVVIQPSAPIEYEVKGMVLQSELETSSTAPNENDVLFLLVGKQIGYVNKKIFDYL